MTLYVVERADRTKVQVSAGQMVVHDGHLYGSAYSHNGEGKPTGYEAAFAPGEWLSFEPVSKCPNCDQQIRKY